MENQTHPEFLQVQNPTESWLVKSSSSDENYSVLTDGQLWSCTCLSYFYRGYCKHITSIKDKNTVK
jgi:hypothetical protein